MNHLIYKSFIVAGTRWPWKFVFNPITDIWYGYSATDHGKGDGIRRGWDLQCEYSSYEDLRLCFKYAEEMATIIELGIRERQAGGQ